MNDIEAIKERVRQIVKEKFGRVEENLTASGIVDSLRAVQLAIALEQAFMLEADSFELSDMTSIDALSKKIRETLFGTNQYPKTPVADG